MAVHCRCVSNYATSWALFNWPGKWRFLLEPRIALGGKKTPSLVFVSLKNSAKSWAEPFCDFSWGTKSNGRRHRKLRRSSNTHQLFSNWRNFAFMSTKLDEWLQCKYCCNYSGKTDVFDHHEKLTDSKRVFSNDEQRRPTTGSNNNMTANTSSGVARISSGGWRFPIVQTLPSLSPFPFLSLLSPPSP